MNWFDGVVAIMLLGGVAFGAQRGVLRQALLMAAFYVSLLFAARYYGEAAGFVVDYLPHADRSVASAYVLAGLTAGGTLMLTWMSHQVYGSTALPRVEVVDRVAGAGLGVAWSWAVTAFAVTVLIYGLSFSWGANEALRIQLSMLLEGSSLVGAVRSTLPMLRDLLTPWLPGGLPAPLSI